nr:DNA polymerase III subunit gamma/tau [Bacteroidota bacterium]
MEQFVVSARKYRPQAFEAVVGQSHITDTLLKSVANDHLAQALLFCGPRGVGKTTCARILSKVINGGADLTDEELALNIFELDAASNNSVDDIRRLIDQVRFAPQTGKFKVYIIDEVHMLSNSAFNAMLKTLEEPPEHIKFILATTDPKKLPVTVLSRCLQFNLKQMTVEKISNHLDMILGEEKIKFEKKALGLISKSAKGSMRDALSILDQAIAYSGNEISEEKISEMLGVVDNNFLTEILFKLSENKGDDLIEIGCGMNDKNIALDSTLDDLASLIHRVSVYQVAPSNELEYQNNNEIKKLSELF